MRQNIKATNITITDSVRAYLDKRLQSLEKLIDFEDPTVLVAVELGRTTAHHQTGPIFRAEINISRGSEMFRSVAEREDLTTAIDEARDEMARELASRKKRKESLYRRGGRVAKTLLRGSYEGLRSLGKPAKVGWRYVKELKWWKQK